MKRKGRVASSDAARRGGQYLADNYLPPHPIFDLFRRVWGGGGTVDVLDQAETLAAPNQFSDANREVIKLAPYLALITNNTLATPTGGNAPSITVTPAN